MARKGRRATYDERVWAVREIEEGMSPDVAADILNVGRESVFRWWREYRAGGVEALRAKKTRGRPAKLDDAQVRRLYTLIEGANPRQLSFDFGLWTRKLVGELIWREFRVRLSDAAVGRLLRRMGMSPQRPLYRAYQQDPERVERWKTAEYPAIRSRAAREGAAVFFADESSVRTDYHAGTTWAPIGQTPVVTATGARKAVKMISAISLAGQVRFHLHVGSMDRWTFIAFCKQLISDSDKKIFLIVDGSSIHSAGAVKDFVARNSERIELFFLPPYSPELNPDEWVNKNVKHDRVARAVIQSEGDLWNLMLGALQRLQKAPHIVRAFFRDPTLNYILPAET
jgi:transposase